MFGVVKAIAARHTRAAELNDWNDRNLCRGEMSAVLLASRQAGCLELVGKLLCCLASEDTKGEREAVAYLYHDLCLLFPQGARVRFAGGMSADLSFLAQAVCGDPVEAVMHLYAFASARDLNLHEIVLTVLGDSPAGQTEFAAMDQRVVKLAAGRAG